jgi:hypothetical protein
MKQLRARAVKRKSTTKYWRRMTMKPVKPRAYGAVLLMALSMTGIAHKAHAATADRVQEMNGVTFVSGGIGSDSRESLAAREKSYNFKLVMTLEGSGTFVADARVTLTTASGQKLIETVAEGPLFLAGLPAGAYVVNATFRNVTQSKKFQVRSDRLHTEYLRWRADPQLDVTTPWEERDAK